MYFNKNYTKKESSLIGLIVYSDETDELMIGFHASKLPTLTYSNVDFISFTDLISADSIGRHYLNYIKQKFKIMANKPTGINKSSNKTRYIKLRLDVTKLNKDYFFEGKSGVYADVTLHMRPDGEVDKYENLGFITQDVPYELAKKNKELKGEIIGNAQEQQWGGGTGGETNPSEKIEGEPGLSQEAQDDLPF